MMNSASTPPARRPGINDMCDDVLLEIFSYISVRQLARYITRVCTRWKALIHQERHIWKYKWLVWDMSNHYDDFEEVIERIPNLCCLKLYLSVAPDHELPKILKSVPMLQRLVLTNVWSNRDDLLSFMNGPHLQYLSVDYITKCYDQIGNFKNLTTLRLNFSFNFCGSHLREITNKCKFLTKLSVVDSRAIHEDDLLYFVQHRKECLEGLEVNGYSLSDNVFLFLAQCKKLKHLRVNDARLMTEHALGEIGSLPSLKVLIIKRLRLTKEQIPVDSLEFLMGTTHHYNIYLEDDHGRVLFGLHSRLIVNQSINHRSFMV